MRLTPALPVAWVALGLLTPGRAVASSTLHGGSGSVSTRATIDGPCDCNPSTAFIEFPSSEGDPNSATLSCPGCDKTVQKSDGSSVSGFVGATHVDAAYDGNDHFLRFTAHASGGADSTVLGPQNTVESGGSINFSITGQAEAVAISVSISVSGESCAGIVSLSGTTAGEIGRIFADKSGQQGAITGGVLQPGDYTLSANLNGDGSALNPGAFGYSVTMSVTLGVVNEIHWTNPAGGDFNTVSNWSPQQVPASGDTAIFDLGNPSPIPIQAGSNDVGRMVIRSMGVDLNGPVQASGNSPSFLVTDGGTFVLDDSVQFFTNDADIGGDTGVEASVFVSGAGSKFSNLVNPVIIGNIAPGRVVVDHDGALVSIQDINLGAQATGTLKVESGGQALALNCTLKKGSIQVRDRGTLASNLDVAAGLSVSALNGDASLVIENSATVEATQVVIGDASATGAAAVTISDANGQGGQAQLKTDGTGTTFQVAGSVGAQVDVQDGGVLTTAADARVGLDLAIGKVLVHGKHNTQPAHWDVAGALRVGGRVAASELVISDGGRVTAAQLALGANQDELGSAAVSGEESQLLPTDIFVGRDGNGTLEITAGAKVIGENGIVGASHQTEGTSNPPSSGGTGQGLVIIGDNSLADSKWFLSRDCSVGTDEPGTIILKGVAVAGVNLGGATLEVGGQLVVGVQGTLTGIGKLVAPNVSNSGTIGPGLSPGVITIEGNFEQKPEGVLKIEIAGLEDGQFDVLKVTGDATLGGTLEVHFLDGFLPKTDDSVDFLQLDGNVTSEFSKVSFPELAPGFESDLTFVDGKLRLTARSDAVAANPTILSPLNCGAGTCGAGSAAMLPLTMLALLSRKRRWRRL